MRVIFTAWAWPSHLHALAPLAWATRLAGHDVLLASQPAGRADVLATGLPYATVGSDVDTVEIVREFLAPPAGGPGGNGMRAMRMVLAHAESMTDDLVDLVRDWRADLVVHDPTAMAGPIAAAANGIPSVRHLYGTDLMARAAGALPKVLAPLASRHGVGEFDPMGVTTVDPVPAILQVPTEHRRLGMRWIPFNGNGNVPVRPSSGARRPRVCVTWGHTIAKLDADRFLVPRVLSALSGLDVDVVAAVSGSQADLVKLLPANASVRVDAPLWSVVPDCDLVVGHGGAGTVLTSLSHGVPLLLVPALPDHAGHAGRVAAAGAGRTLAVADATESAIRAEVEALLGDSAEKSAAIAVQAEIRAQAAPAELVPELEALATKEISCRS